MVERRVDDDNLSKVENTDCVVVVDSNLEEEEEYREKLKEELEMHSQDRQRMIRTSDLPMSCLKEELLLNRNKDQSEKRKESRHKERRILIQLSAERMSKLSL